MSCHQELLLGKAHLCGPARSGTNLSTAWAGEENAGASSAVEVVKTFVATSALGAVEQHVLLSALQ